MNALFSGFDRAHEGTALEQLTTSWAHLLPFMSAADLKAVSLTLRGNVLRYSDLPVGTG